MTDAIRTAWGDVAAADAIDVAEIEQLAQWLHRAFTAGYLIGGAWSDLDDRNQRGYRETARRLLASPPEVLAIAAMRREGRP